ncbi:DUF4065 domain-containing protein [candidate division KSB1 bacterium]|nr:DUF4065 domain-containing protein [candidate division KSB1 bacterium]
MYSIDLIAKYIIWLYKIANEKITNMQLQKLCYYVQAWYLANYHRPFFKADFEAWIYGPVCHELYRIYKKFGKECIEVDIDQNEFNLISKEDQEYITQVIGIYNKFSAIELMIMTHDEAPWKNARNGLAADEQCFNIIPQQVIEQFFSERINEKSKN